MDKFTMLTMRIKNNNQDNEMAILIAVFNTSTCSNKHTHLFLSFTLHADDELPSSSTRSKHREIMFQHTRVLISHLFLLP